MQHCLYLTDGTECEFANNKCDFKQSHAKSSIINNHSMCVYACMCLDLIIFNKGIFSAIRLLVIRHVSF